MWEDRHASSRNVPVNPLERAYPSCYPAVAAQAKANHTCRPDEEQRMTLQS